jgi:hypothetical protein
MSLCFYGACSADLSSHPGNAYAYEYYYGFRSQSGSKLAMVFFVHCCVPAPFASSHETRKRFFALSGPSSSFLLSSLAKGKSNRIGAAYTSKACAAFSHCISHRMISLMHKISGSEHTTFYNKGGIFSHLASCILFCGQHAHAE